MDKTCSRFDWLIILKRWTRYARWSRRYRRTLRRWRRNTVPSFQRRKRTRVSYNWFNIYYYLLSSISQRKLNVFAEVKQELEDLMADIKKSANRVRSKLKGEHRKKYSVCFNWTAKWLDSMNSDRAEHRTRRADEQIIGRLEDTQDAALDAVAQVRRSDDRVQPDADRLPRTLQRAHPASARNQYVKHWNALERHGTLHCCQVCHSFGALITSSSNKWRAESRLISVVYATPLIRRRGANHSWWRSD